MRDPGVMAALGSRLSSSGAAVAEPVLRLWRAVMRSSENTTTLFLGMMLAGGVVLRLRGLAAPEYFTFDEDLFAKNAHNYLVASPDTNDHPPLGKLLMAVGMLLFGYNSLGWRFASACFGLQCIVIAYWLARALFEDRRSGWFAAAFVAADGFFIAYSRTGLLDGMLTCFVLWSVLLAVTARSALGVLGSALMVGLATSIKWSGSMSVIPAAAAVLWLGRAPRSAVLLYSVVPALHAAIWTLGLRLTGSASDLPALWRVMSDLFRHHLDMGKGTHPVASPWYSWIGLYHPIVLKISQHGLLSRFSSTVGNPLLWYAGSVLAIGLPLVALLGTFWSRARKLAGWFDPATRRGALLLALGWFALFSPWIVARGKYTFIYHYLPSYGFALVLVAGFVATLERKRADLSLLFTLFGLCVATYFAPVWAELPILESAAHRRLIFTPWR